MPVSHLKYDIYLFLCLESTRLMQDETLTDQKAQSEFWQDLWDRGHNIRLGLSKVWRLRGANLKLGITALAQFGKSGQPKNSKFHDKCLILPVA